jgi:hypothetical protein
VLHRLFTILTAIALLSASAAVASVREAGSAAHVNTAVSADTVTVGQRFDVRYDVTYADTLTLVSPIKIAPGSCRVVDSAWEPTADAVDGRVAAGGRVTFIAVNLDSVHVPAQAFDFVAPAGDTLRAWSDPVDVGMRYLSAGAEDLRPLKEQWTMSPNWLLWIALGVGAVALAIAAVWWIRRRRARRPLEVVPEVRIPPDVAALAELDRIEAMGLVARGEFKTFYTLVADAVRRYLEGRFGVEALERTTYELLDEMERRRLHVDGLAPLLNQADLVKFAKYKPDAETADAALGSARHVVVSSTRRAASSAPGPSSPEQEVVG